ncbi:hypothetical protein M1105_10470 [Limibaculum sp. FT325]|uniref:hypothetical protein n=1 Tax=Thermohalobaculum sediminis TaxID=2939436 RepID=UPI0020C0BFF1|nr:hypothetical protein [Limibaculum sediminis]MCL5777411.1 hypothetical protein [Limibaculum sediminis]
MSDWIIAFLAVGTLAAFLGIIAVFVPVPDLMIVLVAVVVFAAIDFLRDLRNGTTNGK